MSPVSAEMTEAVGISHLFPIAPIMQLLSMFLMLLLLPVFWKTRIVALVSVVGWIFIGNLASFVGMIHWRGHANDDVVLASILAVVKRALSCGYTPSWACFAYFVWQRLQPLSARHLYDTRRRDNLIHLFLSLIFPVLWAPLVFLSCDHRYTIVEDFGPMTTPRRDWPGLLVRLPNLLGCDIIVIFSVLALVRYWRAKQEDVESDPLKCHPSVQTRKLLFMAVANMLFVGYSIYRQTVFWRAVAGNAMVPRKSMAENITSLQLVLMVTRPNLDTSSGLNSSVINSVVSIPLDGFYVFAWFGCGVEARKAYGDALWKFVRVAGAAGTLLPSWSAIAPRKAKPHQGLLHSLPPIPPSTLQPTPYMSPLPQEHLPQLSPGPMTHPSSPVGNVIDSKRRARPKDPVRRLSSHKPAFIPLDLANTAVHTIAPVPNPPVRRRSYHKPAVRPLDPANPTPNTILQEEFAPRSQPRRISYHKPPFRPFLPVNVSTRRATSDVLGTSIPLVDVQRRPESSRATGLLATGTVDALPPAFPTSSTSVAPPRPPLRPPSYLAPPPLLSPSTSTAPSSLSSERTPTPAPPYQDMNTLFGHTT